MPVPITPIGNQPPAADDSGSHSEDFHSGIDFAHLGEIVKTESSKRAVKLSDSEASLLFKVWRESGSSSDETLEIPDTVSNSDILRLKTLGLVAGGDVRRVKFTERARQVIKTIVLNEENTFESMRVHKPYNQILAENAKKGQVRLALDKKGK
jgi:hypothetical protein